MSIQVISVSHKNAPLRIRELFAFTEDQQKHMMEAVTEHIETPECVVLSTCNRTEMYVYADSDRSSRVFGIMEDILLKEAGASDEDVGDYFLFYNGRRAIDHLFSVATGLDSMVVGEDQILGQVKTAHKMARSLGTTGVYLNTFFRDAVTAAKKVKTKTDLSKTSVSTATLAVKIAEEELGSLKDKKVMIIGATGRIGGIVLMNIQSLGQAEIYVTTRNNKIIRTKHGDSDFITIDYDDRYDYLDDMDVVISATASPHYTLSYIKMKNAMVTPRKRVFVDLAVPMDIDARIQNLEGTSYYNIDDFTRIAEENNTKKKMEARAAYGILEEYELQFEQWMVFQQSLPIMRKARDNFMKVAEEKGEQKAFDHLFFWVRENNNPDDLEVFFRCLNH